MIIRLRQAANTYTPPPCTLSPQYKGVAGETLDILHDKTVVLLPEIIKGNNNCLWVEVIIFSCQMSNRCITSVVNTSTSPCELLFGRRSHLDSIATSDSLGFLRSFRSEHELWLAEGFPPEHG